MIIHNPILTGSFTVNGTDVASITSSAASINAINSYTASQNILNGTYTLTSSFAAQTASFTAFTSSVNSFTASQLVLNGTYATTSSNTFKNPQTINSNLIVTGSITAATLVVQTITSSVIYSSGSNVFGNNIANTQVFTGSMFVTGSSAFLGSVSAGTNFRLNGNSFSQVAIIDGSGGFGGGYNFNLNSGTPQHDSTGTMAAYYYDSSGNIRFFASGSQASGTSAQERMRITSTGNVGIGTTNPGTLLQVAGSSTTYSTAFSLYNTSNSKQWNFTAVGSGAGNRNGNLEINNNTIDILVISQSGNIGVGTTTPNSKLEVYGSAQNSPDTSNAIFKVNSTSTNAIVMGTLVSSPYGCYIQSGGSGTYPLLLNPNGAYVGINTTNPQARLQVNGAGSSELTFQLNDGSTRRCFFIPSQYYGYMWALGIVANGGKGWSFGNQDGTEVGTIVINAGGVAYNTTSDYRLKEDLKDFNGLEKVSAIKVYDFKWKNLDERTNGVLAHELAEVLPYAVSGVKDALNHEGKIEAQSVDYSKLTPVLVKAIQELKTQNDDLQAQITELKNK